MGHTVGILFSPFCILEGDALLESGMSTHWAYIQIGITLSGYSCLVSVHQWIQSCNDRFLTELDLTDTNYFKYCGECGDFLATAVVKPDTFVNTRVTNHPAHPRRTLETVLLATANRRLNA